LTLAVVMFFMVRTMLASSPSQASGTPDLIVSGHQWWWEVQYPISPGHNVITANEIHIPAGKRLLLELRASDVIHDFWVPELGRKIDAIPGQPNQIWLEADRIGTYLGFCAEFCGGSHAWMQIRVIAESEPDYQKWLAGQAAPASVSNQATLSKNESVQRGLVLFKNKTCINCHQISGVSTPIEVGPDLTHLASRETLVAGALKNNNDDLARWLDNPDRVKPGAHMPAFKLTQAETSDLISFLGSLQ
jgi:cytochrome c oxidase subunit 2